ncbi:MAG: ribonuclease HII [Candidatus Latescibacteria bacterium]|nr:ribonuclease HII [Candidatus Latescibacterota bacterium]
MPISKRTIAQIRSLIDEKKVPLDELLPLLEQDIRAGVRGLAQRERRRLLQEDRERQRIAKLLRFERELWERGVRRIAGVDEVGRGPLAGPVVAAAVILPQKVSLPGLDDSKKLSEGKREILYDLIRSQAEAVSVGSADHVEIDRTNILRASLRAMRESIEGLPLQPDRVLVDGSHLPGSRFPERAIVDGDARSLSIAAASVIAKVTRDRLMVAYDETYPEYGFARHKGYGTADRIAALREVGPCPIHRRSFRIVGDLDVHGSEDFRTFREGLEQAESPDALLAMGRAIARVKDDLEATELQALRQMYQRRQVEMTSGRRKRIGGAGEALAARFLEEKGYRILERNWRDASGELDLIAQHGETLVFAEVKTGKAAAFGPPEMWVTEAKQRQVVKVAKAYLSAQNIEEADIRFDVVGIEIVGKARRIEHIENAFREEE